MSKLLALFAVVLTLASVALAEEQPAEKAEKSPAVADESKAASADAKEAKDEKATEPEDPEKVDWTKVDWRKKLTRLQYEITRNAGTERPFRNQFWDFFKPGEYRCVGCGLPLFEADSKFDSECGWPSFDKTIAKNAITEHVDLKMLQPRTEIRCRRCEAHLGHVFNDGPTDTGLRYCLNSAAMSFVPEKQLEKDKAKKVATNKEEKPAEEAAPATSAEKPAEAPK